jgi:hypothetical protein
MQISAAQRHGKWRHGKSSRVFILPAAKSAIFGDFTPKSRFQKVR